MPLSSTTNKDKSDKDKKGPGLPGSGGCLKDRIKCFVSRAVLTVCNRMSRTFGESHRAFPNHDSDAIFFKRLKEELFASRGRNWRFHSPDA